MVQAFVCLVTWECRAVLPLQHWPQHQPRRDFWHSACHILSLPCGTRTPRSPFWTAPGLLAPGMWVAGAWPSTSYTLLQRQSNWELIKLNRACRRDRHWYLAHQFHINWIKKKHQWDGVTHLSNFTLVFLPKFNFMRWTFTVIYTGGWGNPAFAASFCSGKHLIFWGYFLINLGQRESVEDFRHKKLKVWQSYKQMEMVGMVESISLV